MTIYYLIGQASSKITGENLPTLREMLKILLFYHYESKLSVHESASEAVKQAEVLWVKHNIKLKSIENCTRNLEKAFNDWKSIEKNKLSGTEVQRKKRADFTTRLDDEFDMKTYGSKQSPQLECRPPQAPVLAQRFRPRTENLSHSTEESDESKNLSISFQISLCKFRILKKYRCRRKSC